MPFWLSAIRRLNETQVMNRKQKCLLYAAAAVIVVMGLFPPWTHYRRGSADQRHVGYYALWSVQYSEPVIKPLSLRREPPPDPPFWPKPPYADKINSSLLLVQWIGVCLASGALWLAFKDRGA